MLPLLFVKMINIQSRGTQLSSGSYRNKQVKVGQNHMGDHDCTHFSQSPSMSFFADIPEDIDGSFHNGEVHFGLKENCFEPSPANRHA